MFLHHHYGKGNFSSYVVMARTHPPLVILIKWNVSDCCYCRLLLSIYCFNYFPSPTLVQKVHLPANVFTAYYSKDKIKACQNHFQSSASVEKKDSPVQAKGRFDINKLFHVSKQEVCVLLYLRSMMFWSGLWQIRYMILLIVFCFQEKIMK